MNLDDLSMNHVPDKIRKVHLMGVCGTGMAALAGMLKSRGLDVGGSDQAVYPPMSEFLEKQGIPVEEGYRPENLNGDPDLVIVGNVIRRDNPEAEEMRKRRLPFLSMAQAVSHFFIRGRRSIVAAGTHGKTTTCSMIAWVLESAGLDPGFMIGGILSNFGRNYQVGDGPFFVTEGDEYDTAYFDKGPKFLHYRPEMLILTSIEFDHADIYRDLEHVKESFRKLLRILPERGVLIANKEDERVMELARTCPARIRTYGLDSGADWSAVFVGREGTDQLFEVLHQGEPYGRFRLPMIGEHNLKNALAVVALAHESGLDRIRVAEALASFRGVRRRQEVRGEKRGILIMDDFAHHPTEVKETVAAVRHAYPDRRLVAVFEPRTNTSRRNVFQELYPDSFKGADQVFVRQPPDLHKVSEDQRFSSQRLAADLAGRGLDARYFEDTDALLKGLLAECRAGDLVLIMSNGGFDGLHGRLLNSL